MKIGHIHLEVSDLARSIAFYRDKIGLTLTLQQADFAVLDAEPVAVFLDQAKEELPARKGIILAFAVDDADTVYKTLKARGVELTEEPKDRPWGARSFYFQDPDGYTLEVEG